MQKQSVNPFRFLRRAAACLFSALLLLALPACASPASGSGGTIALIHATLIDGSGGPPVPDSLVLVRGGQIVKAGSYTASDIPADATVRDLSGCTVLPGFINMHVHRAYDEARLKKWLSCGVTTVRDESPMAVSDPIGIRDRLGRDPSCARIVSATPIITTPGGYGSSTVKSVDDASAAVQRFVNQGFDVIKFSLEDNCQGSWAVLPADQARALVDAAHKLGRKASVHITHVKFLQTAMDIGVDDLAHMVTEPLDEVTAQAVAAKGVAWVPTLELWLHVSEHYGSQFNTETVANTGVIYKAGVKIALGTDYAGFAATFEDGFPLTEVKLMSRAGMGNMDIIMAGTRNAADVIGLGDSLGTLVPGKAADVLVVRGDPLASLDALADTRMVIHGGKIIVDNK